MRCFVLNAFLCACAVSACGGGGGGAPGEILAPNVGASTALSGQDVVNRGYTAGVTPRTFETDQYLAGPAGAVGASEAYARGAFGAGVRVGVLDGGVNDSTGLLQGRLVADPGFPSGGGFSTGDSHGLLVATTVAAQRGGSARFHGVAPEATIVSYDVSGGTSLLLFREVRAAVSAAAASNTRILNMSFGSRTQAGSALDIADTDIGALVQGARNGLVFVVSAGNMSGTEVSTLAALPIYTRDYLRRMGQDDTVNPLEGSWLAVAGLDESGRSLASFSNRCGLARSFCLSAPGVRAAGVDTGGNPVAASGTSFAAPHVAGALAVLASMWPELSNKTLVEILLRTADDLGEPGVDGVFGYGALNLARAAAPVGALALPQPGRAPDYRYTGAVASSALVASRSMGGALARMAAAGPSMAVVDAYGRGFAIDMAAFAVEARRESMLSESFSGYVARRDLEIEAAPGVVVRLAADPEAGPASARALRFDAGTGMVVAVARDGAPSDIPGVASFASESEAARSALIDPSRLENPFLALAETASGAGADGQFGPARVGVFALTGEGEGGGSVQAVGVTAGIGDASLGLKATAGVVREQEGFLGASGRGLFRFGDSDTVFGSLSARASLSRSVTLIGDLHFGATQGEGGGGLMRGGHAVSSAWTVGVSAESAVVDGDAVALTVGEPLTVRSGALDYAVSTSDGSFRAVRGDLSGAAPLDVGLGWRWSPTERDTVGLAGFVRMRADEDVGAALRWSRRF